jgi:sugar O-acyltransferase (sialic acid O-acetyltransferase NeuD family)
VSQEIVIFGSGELAEVVSYYFENEGGRSVAGFVVDDEFVNESKFCGRSLVGTSELNKTYDPGEYDAFVATGYSGMNSFRATKCEQLRKLGYNLASFISNKSIIAKNVIYGDNCLILEHNTVQPFTAIGNNVFLWSGNHIGHHSSIGPNSFVSSHCVVSGGVKLGKNVFLGVNCAIADHVEVGDFSLVSAGALVTSDVAEGSVIIASQSRVASVKSHQIPNF